MCDPPRLRRNDKGIVPPLKHNLRHCVLNTCSLFYMSTWFSYTIFYLSCNRLYQTLFIFLFQGIVLRRGAKGTGMNYPCAILLTYMVSRSILDTPSGKYSKSLFAISLVSKAIDYFNLIIVFLGNLKHKASCLLTLVSLLSM